MTVQDIRVGDYVAVRQPDGKQSSVIGRVIFVDGGMVQIADGKRIVGVFPAGILIRVNAR